ncbi:MAG: hypothetical protein ACI9RP_003113 [Cyclobacteriaceae bacterium]|jgi:hypothetical protein
MSKIASSGLVGSLKIAFVVGTLLCLTNLYRPIVNQELDLSLVLKIFLNYLIPFSVASYSKFQLRMSDKKEGKG